MEGVHMIDLKTQSSIRIKIAAVLGLYLFSCDEKKQTTLKSSFDIEGEYQKYSEFFPNGNLKQEYFFLEGKLDSISSHFYKEGSIHKQNSYFNGINFGNQYIYNTNGKLKEFSFNDIYEEKIFTVNYEGDGLNFIGNPIHLIYNKNNLIVNEKFELMPYFAIPPGFSMKYSILENNELINNNRINLRNHYYATSLYIENKYIHIGENFWKVNLNLKDSLTGLEYKYTDSITVQVR